MPRKSRRGNRPNSRSQPSTLLGHSRFQVEHLECRLLLTITPNQAITFVNDTWGLTQLSTDAISQTLGKSYSPQAVSFMTLVDTLVHGTLISDDIISGQYSKAASDAANWGIDLGSEAALEAIGLAGVGDVAQLAAFPIQFGLSEFYQAVQDHSFGYQAQLFFDAVAAGNDPSQIIAAASNDPPNVLDGDFFTTSEGWLVNQQTNYNTPATTLGGTMTAPQFFELLQSEYELLNAQQVLSANSNQLKLAFQAAATTATPGDPTILSAYSSPAVVSAGSPTSIAYSISAPTATNVLLGASLQPVGGGAEVSLSYALGPAVPLHAGGNSPSRQYTVPAGTPSGIYNLDVKLWQDENGDATIDNGDVQLSQLTAQNAVTIQPTQVVTTGQAMISSVIPPLSISSSPQTLKVLGTGFSSSSTLSFIFNGGSPIPSTAAQLHWISPTEIDYDFYTGPSPGRWSVYETDASGSSAPFGFSVGAAAIDTTPPTAALYFPSSGSSVSQSTLNAGGFFQVTYSDLGTGVNTAAITSSGPTFGLLGSAAAGVTMLPSPPTLVSRTTSTYRYGFTGSFGTGAVTVGFVGGAFRDNAGNGNIAASQTFTVTSSAVQTGGLQETITPQTAIAAGAQWSVDGENYVNSGTVISGLSPGTHTLQFKPISGWTTPATQTVTVAAGQTTPYSAVYSQQQSGPYYLSVLSDNGNVYRSPIASYYAAGTTVTLDAAPNDGYKFNGWSGGASGMQNPLTITLNSNQSITANFVVAASTLGAMQITITPAAAVAAGAKWRVGGGPWLDSGAIATNLSIPWATVQYLAAPGFTQPNDEFVPTVAGQTTVITRQYAALPQVGNLQVAIPSAGATAAGAMWRVDSGTWLSNGALVSGLAAGSHQVDFEPVPGWITPASQTIMIQTNQTTLASGDYAPAGGAPAISSIGPNTGPLAGGTTVVITGVNFAAPASVTFDGIAATNVTVNSANQITATLPAHSTYGTVGVSVTVPGGTATSPNGFTYVIPRGNGLQLVGQIGGAVNAVAVQGSYAYIGEGDGFDVVNVSNPSAPAVVGHIPLPALPQNIVVSGSYAYVADADGGLQIVDVTNPSAPAVKGFYDLGSATGVAIVGANVYVADGSAGLNIFDVSNPAAPRCSRQSARAG